MKKQERVLRNDRYISDLTQQLFAEHDERQRLELEERERIKRERAKTMDIYTSMEGDAFR